MSDDLVNKYRPNAFDEVVGHDVQLRSLKNALKKGSAKTFLFIGPSGVGKTTLARIAAKEVGCHPQDREEIDAATHTGIEEMRAVTARLLYKPLGEGSVKALIVDECHALSKNAFQSLLKILEEPPPWVYWFLCTTEPTRVLPTIKTRCLTVSLAAVPPSKLGELYDFVCDQERIDLPGDVGDLIIKEAGGSPRQLLVNLAACAVAKSMDEARRLLQAPDGTAEAVELARLLIKGAAWRDIQVALGKLPPDLNPESARHVIRAYVTKVVLNAKSPDQAGYALEVLDPFLQPFHASDGVSPLVMACGKAVLGAK